MSTYTNYSIDGDTVTKPRTPRQRYASWAASNAGLEARAFMHRRQLSLCLSCSRAISLGEAEIDHYIPISAGCDPLDESNMYVVCRACNRKKGPREGRYRIQVEEP